MKKIYNYCCKRCWHTWRDKRNFKMKLTKRKAKELSIKKWQWFYDNPEKGEYPTDEYNKFKAGCPLCELYYDDWCCECPMDAIDNCLMIKSYYSKWANTNKSKTRKLCAGKILDVIKNWEI